MYRYTYLQVLHVWIKPTSVQFKNTKTKTKTKFQNVPKTKT